MFDLLRVVASHIQSGLDLIVPRPERLVRLSQYTDEALPVTPQEQVLSGAAITTLMSYREKSVEDCIRALKYDSSEEAAQLLADILAEYLREEIASLHTFSERPILLVPVPLHSNRFRERGFNQIALVLERLPAEFKNGDLSVLAFNIIARSRETLPQTRLSREERFENVRGAFVLADPETARVSHTVLIDDVTTTGATLAEAARPLRAIGASVSLLALARA